MPGCGKSGCELIAVRCYIVAATKQTLPDDAYARLLALRTGLRHFERWSAQQAEAAGLTPAQHQLLLAIRGHGDPSGPSIGEVADYLLLRHHSTVGLIDRAEAAGLVERHRDPTDHRLVRLRLSELGEERLAALSSLHLEELERLARDLPWRGLAPLRASHGGSPTPIDAQPTVEVARVYDPPTEGFPQRVLVDRLWPRGLSRHAPPFERWLKDIAPSSALRSWYGHDPGRFAEFATRYRAELAAHPAAALLEELRAGCGEGLILLTATKDVAHSGAAVLRDVLVGS
jgi:uncharacterized protein YeaO (DUF488 family)/DNA-binding MarR family transcriptional regulator